MSAEDDDKPYPRSMRHKRILDVAADHPDLSIDEVASRVPSATTDLVERIFEKYGDPAVDADTPTGTTETMQSTNETPTQGDDETGTTEMNGSSGTDDGEADLPPDGGPGTGRGSDTEPPAPGVPSPEDLTAKQREVLSVVADHPEATQREIGDRLGMSGSTVSTRVNDIEDFEWSRREAFVSALFDDHAGGDPTSHDDSAAQTVSTDGTPPDDSETNPDTDTSRGDETDGPHTSADIKRELEQLQQRVGDLEVSRRSGASTGESVFADPELVHKVVHACLEAEAISKEEELRILKELLT